VGYGYHIEDIASKIDIFPIDEYNKESKGKSRWIDIS
jgi:hypothetical protein